MRAALGAGRARIIRQLLTESLLLSLAGGAAGLALAAWAIPRLLALTTLPRAAGVALDATVFTVTLLASLCTGLVFGLAPAVTASRTTVSASTRVRGSAPVGWIRPALLVVELAVAVVLLAGAGLLLRSFYNLHQVETGLRVDRVLTARFFLPRASYPVERCVALYEEMIERVRGLPDVESAAAVSVFPFAGVSANVVFTTPARPPSAPGELPHRELQLGDAGVFPRHGHPARRRPGLRSCRSCRRAVCRRGQSRHGGSLLPGSEPDRADRSHSRAEAANDRRRHPGPAAARAADPERA